MKLFKITCLFILLSLSAFAKDSTGVEFKRFAIGIHASPDYCYRNISSLSNSTTFRNQSEKAIIAYTAGADFSFYCKKQFAISLGVDFSQKGFYSIDQYTIDTSGAIIESFNARHNFNYIEIPLKVTYLIGKKNMRLVTSAAITPSFLCYERTIRTYQNGQRKEKQKPNYIYNPFNLFVSGSIGIDCKLGEKMGLKIEPYYSYGLLETISASYSEKLWSGGLNIGCYIGF